MGIIDMASMEWTDWLLLSSWIVVVLALIVVLIPWPRRERERHDSLALRYEEVIREWAPMPAPMVSVPPPPDNGACRRTTAPEKPVYHWTPPAHRGWFPRYRKFKWGE